jgi:ribosomal protein L34
VLCGSCSSGWSRVGVGDKKKRRSSSFLDGDKTLRGRDVVEYVCSSRRDNLEVEQDQGRSRDGMQALEATKGGRAVVVKRSRCRFIESEAWHGGECGI